MIRLLVDSTSDLSLQELKNRNITMIPLSVSFGEETFRDIVELDSQTFYQRLTQGTVHPKTSLPSPSDFLTAFEEAKAAGDELICILLSSALSGTYQSAVNAKELLDYPGIYLVDSRSTACGIRLLVDHAEQSIAKGLSAPEIVAELEELKSRCHVIVAVDTLEYLYKGGRLSRTAAAIGSVASLKPLLSLNTEGKLDVVGKCLGRGKALQFILSQLEKYPPDPAHSLYSVYTHGLENTEKLHELLNERGQSFSGPVQVGSTIGTHVGPGAFGLIYIRQKA